MTRPLEVGDRVHYPNDPRDLGTVVETHRVVTRAKSRFFKELARVQAVILWDRGQHDPKHVESPRPSAWPTCTVADDRCSASWKRHRCVMPDLDEVDAASFVMITGNDNKNERVRRVKQRVGVIAAERDLARAMARLD